MVKVYLLDPPDVDSLWGHIEPLISKSLKHAEGELIPDDLIPHLDDGKLRVWIAVEDGEIIAAMVTEIIHYPRKKIVRVITLSGKDMNSWYQFLPMLEGYAISNGCSSLEAWTRKGMARKLKDWKQSYCVITKDLKGRMQ